SDTGWTKGQSLGYSALTGKRIGGLTGGATYFVVPDPSPDFRYYLAGSSADAHAVLAAAKDAYDNGYTDTSTRPTTPYPRPPTHPHPLSPRLPGRLRPPPRRRQAPRHGRPHGRHRGDRRCRRRRQGDRQARPAEPRPGLHHRRGEGSARRAGQPRHRADHLP